MNFKLNRVGNTAHLKPTKKNRTKNKTKNNVSEMISPHFVLNNIPGQFFCLVTPRKDLHKKIIS